MSENTIQDLNKKEALSIIDDETNRKIEDIKQHIDFICTSLRANANMQANQLLVAIQQLTVEEFCLKYCGDTQVFLSQQNKKRMNMDSLDKLKKRKPSLGIDSVLKKTKAAYKTTQSEQQIEPEIVIKEPLVAQLKRNHHPDINIQLEAEKDLEQLGHFDFITPDKELVSKLSTIQKDRLRKQIEDIQDKLETLKQEFK